MKSLEELALIRDKMKDKIILREGIAGTVIRVGMGTAGIAAGARDVLGALVGAVEANGLVAQATVMQNGGGAHPGLEPTVEIVEGGKVTTTYVKVTPDAAKRIVEEHIKGGKPVAEYTIENCK